MCLKVILSHEVSTMSREMSRLGSGNEIIRSEHSMLEKNDWVKMN